MRRALIALTTGLAVSAALLFACSDDATSPAAREEADSAAPQATTSPTTAPTGTGTSTPPVDPPAPFTPATLGSRLVLWLEGDAFKNVDGSVVWPDKSGAKNDAFQDASTRMPFLVDGGMDGSVNGHGVVRFSGNQFLSIVDNAGLQWGSSDFGFYIVMRHTNGAPNMPTYGIAYGKWTDTPAGGYPGFFMWASYPASTGYVARLDANQPVQSDGGMNDGQLRLVGARKVGSDFELRVGGAQVDRRADASVPDASAFDAPGLPAFIGGRPAQVQQLQGDIAEILAVKGTLSAGEQASLETYLKAKYGM